MTSQKDQIQALITDIDSVLQKTTPRLPWVVSGEMTQQRQILERVRNYLVTFQRRQIAGGGFEQAGARPDLLAHDIYYQPSQAYQSPQVGANVERSQPYDQSEGAAQQMLQALVQEMGYLRSNLVQPLQSDVEDLRQQREALVQEIRQLEAQRQGCAGSLPGQQQVIAEFLQALMSRLQETLPQQVAQTLGSGAQQPLSYGANLALSGSAPAIATTSSSPSQGFGNIQTAQSQSDELLIKLDSTLSIVFESLQRNVQAYEESLSQGLNKMHSLGQQGEMMFTALVSHLASQLGQEASSYLQPPAATRLESARSATTLAGATSKTSQADQSPATSSPSFLNQPSAGGAARPLTLPFPGTELSHRVVSEPASNVSEPSVDRAIDSWLRAAGSAEGESTVDLEIAELNLEGFDLNQLDAQDVNALLELDANLLGTNLSPQPILAPEPLTAPTSSNAAESESGTMSVEDTADIDAALKLLEQLSSELQDQPASVADADAQIDRMISMPSTLTERAAAEGIPEDAKDELDEFYESLFGNQAIGEPSTADLTTAIPALVDDAAPIPADAIGESESAIAPFAMPLPTQPLEVPSSAVQPISTLPAEIQSSADVASLNEVVTPTVSTSADPTLGWDLMTQSLIDQAADPEIPAALLDDELLSGWDFDDADGALSVSATVLSDDLLGIEGMAETDDRAPIDTDSTPFLEAATALREPSSLITEPPPEAVASDSSAGAEAPQNQDEIATLADLFGEVTSREGQSSESSNAPLPPTINPPPTLPAANIAPVVLPAAIPGEIPPTQAGDDRLTDDRYTPASPEEDLLPLQETVEEPEPELWLDESTLNRLSEDLFSLEEAIGDPAILSYESDSEAEAPPYFPEAAAADDATFNQPIAPIALEESMSLDDWSDSLGDVANADPTTNSTQAPPETERGERISETSEAFILEGMDDLFADTPAVPPVTPVSPPIPAQAEPSEAFTLEGMNSLFADPSTSTVPLPSVSTPTNQAPPFTLEGMDDLFGDVPVVISAPLPAASAQTDQALPFTLDGVDELFSDVSPIVEAVPEAPEVMSPALPSEPMSAFSFEQVGDLFTEVPTADESAQSMGIEGAIAPVTESLPEPTSAPLLPFTLEQVGHLFMEVPSGDSPVLDARSTADAITLPEQPSEATSAPFTLDQMGDLFVETPSGEVFSDPLTEPAILQVPPLGSEPSLMKPSTTEPSALEQAFASLMGGFDEPALPSNETESNISDPEKKKGMS